MNEDLDAVLHVPAFPRLTDYTGLWAMEPQAAADLCHMARSIDLAAHVAKGAEPVRSSMEKSTTPGGSVAMIRLIGTLMKGQSSMGGTSTIQARRDVRQAAADPEVAGILLLIDSPGGTVAGTADLAAEVRAAAKAKPVWAHIDDTGASAAYWIASQAARITANADTAMVGSIGTITLIRDYSEAMEKEGVRTLVFATGPLKSTGYPGVKVTDEQIAHVQALIDGLQTSFDAAVRAGRKMTAAELARVRDGGVRLAQAALEARLIDAVQPLSRTLSEFAQAIKNTDKRRAGFEGGPATQLGSDSTRQLGREL